MTDVIDTNAVRRLMEAIGGDFADLKELVEEYINVTPELGAKLRAASESGDLSAIRIDAHALKSNARDFGASKLAELCAELEKRCAAGDVSNIQEAVAEIEAQISLSRAALQNVSEVDLAGS